MNGSIIHHHENSNDKINAGIRVREKHSQYCFACIRNSISSQTSRYLYRVKKNFPTLTLNGTTVLRLVLLWQAADILFHTKRV